MNILKIFLLIFVVSNYVSGLPSQCQRCLRSNTCRPPDCFCCREDLDLPHLTLKQIPQVVFFTFDDAVTDQVAGFYRQLFDSSRKNPNGCPVSMTLFISHENTKYRLVSEFHRKGMEIASHSVTHSTMNGSNFFEEAKAQKDNLAKLANIPVTDITGWRSPFLKPTGDLQPDALKKLGYNYDATLTFSKRSYTEKAPGPFTLDFGYPYECQVKPCPRHKHPGFWEVPVVSLMDFKQQYDCVYVDGCMNAPPDEEAAFKFLWENFQSYYTRTRMPFGINMHPSWFFYPDRLKAMDRFIQKLVSLDDVYIISANKMLEWLKNPTPLQDLHNFAPWACDGREKNLNSGPRLVKTNLPPPPVSWLPMRMNGFTNRRTRRPTRVITITPAPTREQSPRVFTNTPRNFTINSQNTLNVNPTVLFTQNTREANRNDNSGILNANDLEARRNRIRNEIRRQQSRFRPTVPDFRRSRWRENSPTSSPRIGIIPPVQRRQSRRQLLERHERLLQQQRALGDIKRRREEAQRRREEAQRRIEQQQMQQRREDVQQPSSSSVTGNVQESQEPRAPSTNRRQQTIIWTPNLDNDLTEVTGLAQQTPEKMTQERIKIWPHSSSFSSQPVSRTILRQSNRTQEPVNGRNPTSSRNDFTALLQRIESPSATGHVPVTPRPSTSVIPFRYTESPRRIWLSNIRVRPLARDPGRRQGDTGSGFRRDRITFPVPLVSLLQRQRRQNFQQTNNILNTPTDPQRNLENRRITSNELQNQHISEDRNSRQGAVERRQLNERVQRQNTPFRRTPFNPPVSQQIAWNSFIRKMLGPQ